MFLDSTGSIAVQYLFKFGANRRSLSAASIREIGLGRARANTFSSRVSLGPVNFCFAPLRTLGLLTSKSAYFLSTWLLLFEMSGIFFLTLNDINIDLRSYARVIVFCFEAPSGVHFLNFWTKECRRLKFGENDCLMSTSLCCFYVSSQSHLCGSLAA